MRPYINIHILLSIFKVSSYQQLLHQLRLQPCKGSLINVETCWNRFIADKERVLRNALDLLNFYHDWWLLGIGKEKSNPDERIEETGVMDPIDNTTLAEWNRFDALYPAISFALSYIISHHGDSEIIQKIALTNLEDGLIPGTKIYGCNEGL